MKTRKYLCPDCGKVKFINTDKNNYEKYIAKYPRCHPCGAKFSESKLKNTWFKRGIIPWNKGLTVRLNPKGEIKKGVRLSPETEFKKGGKPWNNGKEFLQIRDGKHPNWKGEDVGYQALHSWVKRKLGKANECEKCGIEKNVQWANRSRTYLRDTNDWLQLCVKCHNKYDMGHWGAVKRKWKT